MKKILLTALATSLLFGSCSSDDSLNTANIVGLWRLTAILSDPGDGSGTFRGVDTNATIQFFEDGTFTASEIVCTFSLDSDSAERTSGTYDLETMEVSIIRCGEVDVDGNTPNTSIGVVLEEGNLILNFPCIEACALRFRKIR